MQAIQYWSLYIKHRASLLCLVCTSRTQSLVHSTIQNQPSSSPLLAIFSSTSTSTFNMKTFAAATFVALAAVATAQLPDVPSCAVCIDL
jgi:hypothetical protein